MKMNVNNTAKATNTKCTGPATNSVNNRAKAGVNTAILTQANTMWAEACGPIHQRGSPDIAGPDQYQCSVSRIPSVFETG